MKVGLLILGLLLSLAVSRIHHQKIHDWGFKDLGRSISSAGRSIGRTASSAGRSVANVASSGANTIGRTASSVGHTVGNVASNVGNEVGKVAYTTVNGIKKISTVVFKQVTIAAKSGADEAKKALNEAKQQFNRVGAIFTKGLKVAHGFTKGFVQEASIIGSIALKSAKNTIPLVVNQLKDIAAVTGDFIKNLNGACSIMDKIQCAAKGVKAVTRCTAAVAQGGVNIIADMQCLLDMYKLQEKCMPCICGLVAAYGAHMIGCNGELEKMMPAGLNAALMAMPGR